jgi:hypothetical protein
MYKLGYVLQDRNMLLACSTQIHSCVRRWFNRLIINHSLPYGVFCGFRRRAYSVGVVFFISAYIQFFFSFRNVFDKMIKDSLGYILPHISIFCLVSYYWCERRRRISGKWRNWLLELHIILFQIGAKNEHPIFCPRIYRTVVPKNDVRHLLPTPPLISMLYRVL